MSTKSSIKYVENSYHLYSDVMDSFAMAHEHCPIYLELTDCEFECGANPNGATWVKVQIPIGVAQDLGLVPATSADTSTVNEDPK